MQAKQMDLPLDMSPALWEQMRALFEHRWRRWHRASSFEVAMQDAVTRRLLYLAVLHAPQGRGRKTGSDRHER